MKSLSNRDVRTIIVALAVAVLPLASGSALAEEKAAASATAVAKITYRPPLRGAPASRVGGGTRGAGDFLNVRVLAPNHTGLTASASPTLYWYASGAIKNSVEFVLIRGDSFEPLLMTKLQAPKGEGINRVDLARHGVTLEPGVEYQWSVSAVNDPNQRSLDVVASGYVKRVKGSAELKQQIASAADQDKPVIYANAGYWYDAIAALGKMIEQGKADEMRGLRAALASQVGLEDVAAYDSAAAR